MSVRQTPTIVESQTIAFTLLHMHILPACGLLAISEKLRQERSQRRAVSAAGSW